MGVFYRRALVTVDFSGSDEKHFPGQARLNRRSLDCARRMYKGEVGDVRELPCAIAGQTNLPSASDRSARSGVLRYLSHVKQPFEGAASAVFSSHVRCANMGHPSAAVRERNLRYPSPHLTFSRSLPFGAIPFSMEVLSNDRNE